MSAPIPTVPDDVTSLPDDELRHLHEQLGAIREDLRLEHRRIVDEVHVREDAAAEAARNAPPAPGGSITIGEGS